MNKLLMAHRCQKALKEISAGNSGALADIYEIAGRQMFAVAYNILKDYQLAEDVVQDSLITIMKHAGEIKNGESCLSWIMSIVHNTSLNLIRKRQREMFPGDFLEEWFDTKELGLSEESFLLQDALKTLESDDRQIVLLKAVVGLSHKEIAGIIGIPLAACQKRYQRSLNKLKQCLTEG